MIKIAHLSVWGPHKCGLYHTTKDLVLAERMAGMDARFIALDDKGKPYEEKQKDGDFESQNIKWAYGADILVRHTSVPTHLQCAGKPLIMALHGRPESSFRLEQAKSNPVITALRGKTGDRRYKAYVTFWPEYMDVWSNLIPKDKLYCVPAMVDTKLYHPDNKPYDFGSLNGKPPNILICDVWRDDVTPFNVLFAAAKFVRKYSGRVHIVGITPDAEKGIVPFLNNMKQDGVLGFVYGQTKKIRSLYTAADMVVTPHVIATRVIREALASGVPVVAGEGCKYTPYTANPMDIDGMVAAMHRCYFEPGRDNPREVAMASFGLKRAGEQMCGICRDILKPKSNGRKIFIDLGGHLGETVRRFYREIEDAHEYEIYSFEPDLATYRALDRNVGHIGNVHLVNTCMGVGDGLADFYPGLVNANEGGTTQRHKRTGGVRYGKPNRVRTQDITRWLRSNIKKGDHVVLKMNIEGGEYDIMERLLDDSLTQMIDKCFIQLHAHKFAHGPERQRYQRIEARFCNEAKCKLFMTNKGSYPFHADSK